MDTSAEFGMDAEPIAARVAVMAMTTTLPADSARPFACTITRATLPETHLCNQAPFPIRDPCWMSSALWPNNSLDDTPSFYINRWRVLSTPLPTCCRGGGMQEMQLRIQAGRQAPLQAAPEQAAPAERAPAR